MFYFYVNSKLVSQSSLFSEVFQDFFDYWLNSGYKIEGLDGYQTYDYLHSELVKNLILNRGYWVTFNDCEIAFLTDLEVTYGS